MQTYLHSVKLWSSCGETITDAIANLCDIPLDVAQCPARESLQSLTLLALTASMTH